MLPFPDCFENVMFSDILENDLYIKEVYQAMGSDDLSEPIIVIINLMKNGIYPTPFKNKNEDLSNEYRNEGNSAYKNKKYQKALICYNKALAYAPNMSRAMKLAYSNRSALLINFRHYKACLNDISTCMTMGCPDDILEKLMKRRETAQRALWLENIQKKYNSYAEDFFKIPKRHPDVPCASSQIDITMDSKFPKIVAKTDIKVGTVLALEKAFVVSPCPFDDAGSNYTTCSYCLKMSLNLFPCEGCTLALFCSKQCNELCLKEYHNTECHVAGFVKNRPDIQIPLRAAIKVRNMCKSWDELVALSNRYNSKKVKSSINEIFNSNNPSSLLTFNYDVNFLHGMLFNATLIWSFCIIIINNSECFFPQSGDDKAKAIRAFARILIYLTIFSPPTYMILPESDTFDEITKFSKHPSFGLFPFIGKLKHSCIPNTRAAALNNTMALVALQPIKAGTELTITPVFHWLDCPQTKQDRQNRMLWFYRTVCSCVVCEASPHDWALMRQNSQLSVTQRRKHKMIFSNESPENFFEPNKTAGIYKKICECLELLNDVPFSKEYADMYRYFRKCLLYLQDYKSQNIVLDDSIDVYM